MYLLKFFNSLIIITFTFNFSAVKPAVRGKRALKFHEPGKFVQIAERVRMKSQLEKLQNEISQIARKTGISSATKLALIAPKTEALSEEVPNVEWWDSVILQEGYENAESNDIEKIVKVSTITNLVEHPAQMRPPSKFIDKAFLTTAKEFSGSLKIRLTAVNCLAYSCQLYVNAYYFFSTSSC